MSPFVVGNAVVGFIDGTAIDFAQESFQLKSRYIHFENNNPTKSTDMQLKFH